LDLDRLSSAGPPLEAHACGRCVGLGPDCDERAAADRTAALYTLCFAHPAVVGIVWHGLRDGEEGGGLLRRDCAPKPAFRFLHKLIGTVWHTRAAGVTGPDGCFRFRGFFGDYRVAARPGDTATTALLAHRPGGATLLLPT